MDALLFGWYTRGRKVVNGNDKDGTMHETERDARVSRVIERVRLREEVCARPVAYGTVRYGTGSIDHSTPGFAIGTKRLYYLFGLPGTVRTATASAHTDT